MYVSATAEATALLSRKAKGESFSSAIDDISMVHEAYEVEKQGRRKSQKRLRVETADWMGECEISRSR